MKKIKLAGLAVLLLVISQSSFGQTKVSASDAKGLEAAEAQMFAKISQGDMAYLKDFVADDFFSTNADGVTEDKAQMIAEKDSPKMKMMAASTVKLFDKKMRTYGDVGIITGRARAYMKDTYLVEFLYTAVFVKRNDKWMYTLWQGTVSKDSPPPPPFPAN